MIINAGEIPPDHWTQDPAVDGGRIVGQACHFVGLLRISQIAQSVVHAQS